jgi:hypothetical protein
MIDSQLIILRPAPVEIFVAIRIKSDPTECEYGEDFVECTCPAPDKVIIQKPAWGRFIVKTYNCT